MKNETLFTFFLDSIPSCSRVELFGSWDNFSMAYPMTRDKRKGPGHWIGCHTFTDIICDGDPRQLTNRNGCLLAGGTYWYFYKRDDYIEFHSNVEPFTTTCPLLPGQTVNVLDVPDEDPLQIPADQAANDEIALAFTLDPAARRQNPKPWSRPRKRPSTIDRQRRGHQRLWSKAISGTKRPHTAALPSNSINLSLGLHFSHKSRLSKWKVEIPTESPQVSKEVFTANRLSHDWDERQSGSDRPKSRHGLGSGIPPQDSEKGMPTMQDIRSDILTAYSFFSDEDEMCVSRAMSLPHMERPETAYRPLSQRCATAPSYWNYNDGQAKGLPLNYQLQSGIEEPMLTSHATQSGHPYLGLGPVLGDLSKDVSQSYRNYRWSGSTGVRWSRIEPQEYTLDLSQGLDLDLGREFSLDLSFPSESSEASGPSTAFSSFRSFNEGSSRGCTLPSSRDLDSAAQSSYGGRYAAHEGDDPGTFDLTRRATDPIRTSHADFKYDMTSPLTSKFLATSRKLDERLASQETITPSNVTCTTFTRTKDDTQSSTPPLPSRAPPPPPPTRAPPQPPSVSSLRSLFS